jgi:hypothetical protein
LQPYKVLVSVEVLRLKRPSRQQRDRILLFLESLAEFPSTLGDYQDRDDIGRPVQIKIIGNIALTYWADHAVKEVKVIKIEAADRE